nr:hypothetical protein [Methylomarinum sp. Ch1-1]MDP4522239.1 hypothetical protein [Methylomarinum sp. Ch1-1]
MMKNERQQVQKVPLSRLQKVLHVEQPILIQVLEALNNGVQIFGADVFAG